jgi:hypothetical protein
MRFDRRLNGSEIISAIDKGCFEGPLFCRDAPTIRSTIFSTAFLRFG